MAETRSITKDTDRREEEINISPLACCLSVQNKEEIIYLPFLSGAQRVII